MDAISAVSVSSEITAYTTFTVFPSDLNYVGTLFGGKTLAEMDIVAAKLAQRILRHSPYCNEAVTVSVEKVDFSKPAFMGDNVDLEARLIALGKSSIDMEVLVKRESKDGDVETICNAQFRFVSLQNKQVYPHGLKLAYATKEAI